MAESSSVLAEIKAEDGGEVKSTLLRRTALKAAQKGLQSLAKLVQLLPTATVLVFNIFSPAFTNEGHCHKVNKIITVGLLGFCALSSYFDSFMDTIRDEDGKLHDGSPTRAALAPARQAAGRFPESPCRLSGGGEGGPGGAAIVLHEGLCGCGAAPRDSCY